MASPRPVQVKRLQYRHSAKAAQTAVDAFELTPLNKYIKDAPDAKEPSSIKKRLIRYFHQATIMDSIAHKVVFTVDEGGAIAILSPTLPAPGHPVLAHVKKVLIHIWRCMTRSLEQRKRSKEIRDTCAKMVRRVLGNNVKGAMYIDLLATAPALQGRSYATALIFAVKIIARQQGRGVWLLSTDNNTQFYKLQGFRLAGTDLLGQDNPSWNAPPIVIT